MKKISLLIILFSLLFASCTKTVYVDVVTGEPVNEPDVRVNAFINLVLVAKTNEPFTKIDYGIARVSACVYKDTISDVLYLYTVSEYKGGLTPIMKPDGSCLTYSEWKARNEHIYFKNENGENENEK